MPLYTPENKYILLDEHKDQFASHAAKWIANAMSTAGMTDEDRQVCREAVNGMYAAAKLLPPKHIVFVPSPKTLAFAGSFAAGIWSLLKGGVDKPTYFSIDSPVVDGACGATKNVDSIAIDAVIRDAVLLATNAATRIGYRVEISDAIDYAIQATARARDALVPAGHPKISAEMSLRYKASTYTENRIKLSAVSNVSSCAVVDKTTYITISRALSNISDAAVGSAINITIDAAINAATREATNTITGYKLKPLATDPPINSIALLLLYRCQDCCGQWDGGNQWSGWCTRTSFFKNVVKLDLPEYENYKFYEALCLHSGPRIVHTDFCMISDRPEVLKIDDQNRPHCEDGPSHRWRDSWSLWHWHGVAVDQYVIEQPEKITIEDIDRTENAEVRRIKILRYGTARYLTDTGSTLVDMDARTCVGGATRALLQDKHGSKYLVGTDGSTNRVYYMPVPAHVMTCKRAHSAICGFDEDCIVAES